MRMCPRLGDSVHAARESTDQVTALWQRGRCRVQVDVECEADQREEREAHAGRCPGQPVGAAAHNDFELHKELLSGMARCPKERSEQRDQRAFQLFIMGVELQKRRDECRKERLRQRSVIVEEADRVAMVLDDAREQSGGVEAQ